MFEWMNTVFIYDFLTFVYGNVLGVPNTRPRPEFDDSLGELTWLSEGILN